MYRKWPLALALIVFVACGGDDASPSPAPQGAGNTTATTTATGTASASPTPARPTVGPRAPLAPGATGRADRFRVELLQVSDPWNDAATPAGAGERYVLVAVTIENRSDEATSISFLNFTFLADNQEYSGERVRGAEPYLTPQTVAPGAVVQGFVAAPIPSDAELQGVEFDADTSTDARISFLAGLE